MYLYASKLLKEESTFYVVNLSMKDHHSLDFPSRVRGKYTSKVVPLFF